ncbi:hypothetical protein HZA97_03090 [Candidatus Woesearchaeota archaeon]|nr:hypothetical protein [Candidatus Woesearchaeota archaeon]
MANIPRDVISKELKELSKKISELADGLEKAPLEKVINLGTQVVSLGKKVSELGSKVKDAFE